MQLQLGCRRYVTADAMGMAKVRGKREEEDVDGARIGLGTSTVMDTTTYPGSGLFGEITPLLLLVWTICNYPYRVFLELYLLSYANLLSCSDPATTLILAARGELPLSMCENWGEMRERGEGLRL